MLFATCFLAETIRRPVAHPFSIPSRSTHPFFYLWTLPRSRIHLTCAWALTHFPPPFPMSSITTPSCFLIWNARRIPLHRVAALSAHYSFIFYFATYHHSSRFNDQSCCMGQWMDVGRLLGCFYIINCWYVFYVSLFLEHSLV